MHKETFRLQERGGTQVVVYGWRPDVSDERLRGLVQIAHGMAETAARYERLAQALTDAGFAVYANDHLGHGQTAGCVDNLGVLGEDGFHRMADTLAQLTDQLKERYPGLPVYLLGHSMGSFLVQHYMYRYPGKASGIVLSGTNGPQGTLLRLGYRVAQLEVWRRGSEHRSLLLNALTFGGYNRAFKPVRTPFDWLSRDEAEVDRYIADAYCGAVFSAGFFRDFFAGLLEIHRPDRVAGIPKQTPVFILSGAKDPVGEQGKGIRRLVGLYQRLGLEHVSWKLYPEGRHEMLNETNRDEVMRDIVDWLERQLKADGGPGRTHPG